MLNELTTIGTPDVFFAVKLGLRGVLYHGPVIVAQRYVGAEAILVFLPVEVGLIRRAE